MNEFWFHCKVFLKGLFDSLSFHRTLRILVNDSTIALLTAQILLTNLFLLVGSHFLYHNGITPVLQFLNDSKSLFQYQETYSVPNSTDSIAWFLFKALWLLPVCLICYGCSTVWYQELADCTYKYLKGNQKSSPSKDAAYVIYGTLIWLFLYLQVQILTAITPMVCDNLQPYTDLFFSRVEDSYNHSSYPLFTWTSSMLRLLSLHAVKLLSFFLQVYGYLLMSLLYGWYAFDPQVLQDIVFVCSTVGITVTYIRTCETVNAITTTVLLLLLLPLLILLHYYGKYMHVHVLFYEC